MPIQEYAKRYGTEDVWQVVNDCLKFNASVRPTINVVHNRLVVIDLQMQETRESLSLNEADDLDV